MTLENKENINTSLGRKQHRNKKYINTPTEESFFSEEEMGSSLEGVWSGMIYKIKLSQICQIKNDS